MGGDRMAVSEGPLSGLICKIGELFSWQGISNYILTELKNSKGFQNPNTLFQNHTSAIIQ